MVNPAPVRVARKSTMSSPLVQAANKIVTSPTFTKARSIDFDKKNEYDRFIKFIESSNKELLKIKIPSKEDVAKQGAGAGQGIIKSIDIETGNSAQITLDPEKLDLPGAFTAVDYEIRETPVYEVKGGNFAINEIYGVDVAEAQTARAASGDARKYKPASSGWVGITTYNDSDGNLSLIHI